MNTVVFLSALSRVGQQGNTKLASFCSFQCLCFKNIDWRDTIHDLLRYSWKTPWRVCLLKVKGLVLSILFKTTRGKNPQGATTWEFTIKLHPPPPRRHWHCCFLGKFVWICAFPFLLSLPNPLTFISKVMTISSYVIRACSFVLLVFFSSTGTQRI